MNHRAIFHITKHCSFPAADIALFQRLYTGRSTFLVMDNLRLSCEQGAWTGCTLVAIRVIRVAMVLGRMYRQPAAAERGHEHRTPIHTFRAA